MGLNKLLQIFAYFRQANVMRVLEIVTGPFPPKSLYIIWLVHSLILNFS
jgi:hypothetical protein